jgi:hypothetical protein
LTGQNWFGPPRCGETADGPEVLDCVEAISDKPDAKFPEKSQVIGVDLGITCAEIIDFVNGERLTPLRSERRKGTRRARR